MFAKVTVEFPGKPDNEVVSRLVKVGEVINGDLAVVAVGQGWAVEVPPNEKSEEIVEPVKSALQLELEGKTVDDLKALAKEKAIDLGHASKKADIVAALLKVLDVPAQTA
jgi:hypothetical protein